METLRLEDELRAADAARQERQEEFLRMQRALSLVRIGSEGTPAASTPAPSSRLESATPASARVGPAAARSSSRAPVSTPEPSSVQSQRSRSSVFQPSRDWQKPLTSPAAGADMLDRLEQRPVAANLPGPPRTPGLFFGFKR